MAALRSVSRLRGITSFLNKQRYISSSAVQQKGWIKDYMPEAYPLDEEERRDSAIKHGLIPEDYKPLPDDGDGHGDYPDLPLIGEEQKSPWYNWDDPALKRDYGEPLHLQYDCIMSDKGDPAKNYRVAPYKMVATILTIIGTLFTLYFISIPKSLLHSKYKEWYPYDDLKNHLAGDPVPSGKRQVHYSFEPAE